MRYLDVIEFPFPDILIMNSAGPIIKHQVYKYGRLIYCRNKIEALRYKDTAISEYLDFLPFRRNAEKKVIESILSGG